MDPEFSEELTGLMPFVPHGIAGVDCHGRIIAVVESRSVELRCNRCGVTVGVVQVDVMEGLLGLDCADATCVHCGTLNTLSNLSGLSEFICQRCGKPLQA
jgi:hypothetical protein